MIAEELSFYNKHQINKQAWDNCIENAQQANIYGLSWYLDLALENWGGLIFKNYEAVMPFPLISKIGFNIIPRPIFCQQLGIYGNRIDLNLEQEFIRRFKKIGTAIFEYPFNQYYQPSSIIGCTHLLDLNKSYVQIWQGYSSTRRNKIRKAINFGWFIEKTKDLASIIRIFQENHERKIPNFKSTTYYKLLRLYEAADSRNMAELLIARHPKNLAIEAGILCWKFKNKLTYQFCAASETGKRGEARAWLIDTLIREYAETNYILDFESTPIPSFMHWNASFGAKPYYFSVLDKNAWLMP